MKRWTSIAGYTAAALTVTCAVLTPFVLIGAFGKGVAATGVRIAPEYSGGELSHTIDRQGYRIKVNRPVIRQFPLQRVDSFVQLTWTPAAALPSRVEDAVDLDADGRPDVVVSFDRPAGKTKLKVNAQPLTALVKPLKECSTESFSALIVPVRKGIVVRLPLAREWGSAGQRQ